MTGTEEFPPVKDRFAPVEGAAKYLLAFCLSASRAVVEPLDAPASRGALMQNFVLRAVRRAAPPDTPRAPRARLR